MWSLHLDCKRLVSEVWSKPVSGCAMFVLMQKLKSLKHAFRPWNREVFGNVKHNVIKSRDALDVIQHNISNDGLSNVLKSRELEAQINLHRALAYEEAFWKEKSKNKWFL